MGQPYSSLSFYPSLKDGEGTRGRSQKFNLLQCGTERLKGTKRGCIWRVVDFQVQDPGVSYPLVYSQVSKQGQGKTSTEWLTGGSAPFRIRSIQRGFSPQVGNPHPSSPFFFLISGDLGNLPA